MIYPKTFADRYLTAWNERKIEDILDCFDARAELRSPFAKLFARAGVVKGHDELRAFYEESIRRRPNLRFELLDSFGGHEAIAMHFLDEAGRSSILTAVLTPANKISLAILCYNKGV